AQAGAEPLCLLTPNMQYRRIIDSAFQSAGVAPRPLIETNSIVNLSTTVRTIGLVGVVPKSFRDEFGSLAGTGFRPLIEPEVRHIVGLVTLDRSPLPPL